VARRVLALVCLGVALIVCVALAVSESLTNRTGKTATAVTVTFSEQVRITSYDESVFPTKEPSSRSATFRFSGGQLENGARFSVSWTPASAILGSFEWLSADAEDPFSTEGSATFSREQVLEKLASLEEWTILSGETVVIEGIDISTPTDFVVEVGGVLIIRGSQLCMLGRDHHDNYVRISGKTIIEDSHIWGSPPGTGPSIITREPDAVLEIRNSRLDDCYVQLEDGGIASLTDTVMDALGFSMTARGVEEGTVLSASNCTVTGELAFRLGQVSGEMEFGDLKPGMTAFHLAYGAVAIDLQDCTLPPPLIQNSGGGSSGHFTVRIHDSQFLNAVSWEGGDVTLEHCQVCKLAIRNLQPSEYSGLRDGYFADSIIVDQPTRKIRLVDTTIGGCSGGSLWPYCSTAGQTAHGITLTSQQDADLTVSDSEICGELKVSHGLTARNTNIGELQIYEAAGELVFDACTAQAVSVVISANVVIRGTLSIGSSQVYDWGGWRSFSITRYYPVEVVDADGAGVADATVALLDPDERVLLRARTDSAGRVEVPVHFESESSSSTLWLLVEETQLAAPLRLASSTPVRIGPQGLLDDFSSEIVAAPVGGFRTAGPTSIAPWPSWQSVGVLQSDPVDQDAIASRDILALKSVVDANYLYLRIELRGEPDVTGSTRYLVDIWAGKAREVCYRFSPEAGMLVKFVNWGVISQSDVAFRTADNAIEVALPLALLPPIGGLTLTVEARRGADVVEDLAEAVL